MLRYRIDRGRMYKSKQGRYVLHQIATRYQKALELLVDDVDRWTNQKVHPNPINSENCQQICKLLDEIDKIEKRECNDVGN